MSVSVVVVGCRYGASMEEKIKEENFLFAGRSVTRSQHPSRHRSVT